MSYMASRAALVLLVVAGCRSDRAAPADPPPALVREARPASGDVEQASAAYDAADWPRCAETWMAVAKGARGEAQRNALASAAACYARAGQRDEAFAALETMASELRTAQPIVGDEALSWLH